MGALEGISWWNKKEKWDKGRLCLRITIPGILDDSLLVWNKHQRRSNFPRQRMRYTKVEDN